MLSVSSAAVIMSGKQIDGAKTVQRQVLNLQCFFDLTYVAFEPSMQFVAYKYLTTRSGIEKQSLEN